MGTESLYPLLMQIDSPADLKKLDRDELPALSAELRQYIIDSVSRTGGHLGASLGTVELTVALHYVFNTPADKLVWDVGHQTYGHKILTGRRDRMDSMRMRDGLAGFPNRSESEYDTFGVGHSSTSISAALGMALAARHQQGGNHAEGEATPPDQKFVAIIGDGALTAGLAYEALNHAGGARADMLVILNDNDMSISPNVGAMNKYMANMLTGRIMTGAREGSKKVLSHVPPVLEFARRTEEHVKGMVVPSAMFEALGFNYYGPVDGHDVESLVKVLQNLEKMSGPVFLHVVTRKGHGYSFAENDPLALHAVSPFDPKTGKAHKSGGANSKTYTEVFSDWICDMAEIDPRLVGITPAMREGSGLVEFEARYPERYHDVAIAEQHAVTLAAGMATGGLHPVVAIYSTFLQRAYDQAIHDVAIQNLPVLFAIDRAGLVGPDGPTHAGSFDYSFLRCLPNFTIMAPADENECRQMLYTGMQIEGPVAVRYPRGKGPGVLVDDNMQALAIGRAEVRHKGSKVALLAFGTPVAPAETIAREMGYTAVNMRFVKPLDTERVEQLAREHDLLITLEENAIPGGAGAAVLEHLSSTDISTSVKVIGLPDSFQEHGSREELLAESGLDEAGLRQQIAGFVAAETDAA